MVTGGVSGWYGKTIDYTRSTDQRGVRPRPRRRRPAGLPRPPPDRRHRAQGRVHLGQDAASAAAAAAPATSSARPGPAGTARDAERRPVARSPSATSSSSPTTASTSDAAANQGEGLPPGRDLGRAPHLRGRSLKLVARLLPPDERHQGRRGAVRSEDRQLRRAGPGQVLGRAGARAARVHTFVTRAPPGFHAPAYIPPNTQGEPTHEALTLGLAALAGAAPALASAGPSR